MGSDDEETSDCSELLAGVQANEQSAEADSIQYDDSMRSRSMASSQAPMEDGTAFYQDVHGPPHADSQEDAPMTKLSLLVQVSAVLAAS